MALKFVKDSVGTKYISGIVILRLTRSKGFPREEIIFGRGKIEEQHPPNISIPCNLQTPEEVAFMRVRHLLNQLNLNKKLMFQAWLKVTFLSDVKLVLHQLLDRLLI